MKQLKLSALKLLLSVLFIVCTVAGIALFNVNQTVALAEAQTYVLEAEDADVETGAVYTIDVNKNASGGHYTKGINADAVFHFTFTAEADGVADFYLVLAGTTVERPLSDVFSTITVNGTVLTIGAEIEDHVFAKDTGYYNWRDVSCGQINVVEGKNTISIARSTAGKWLNFDAIKLNSATALRAKMTSFQAEETSITSASTGIKKDEKTATGASGNAYLSGVGKNHATTFSLSVYSDKATDATLSVWWSRSSKESALSKMISTVAVNTSRYTVGTEIEDVAFAAVSKNPYYIFHRTDLVECQLNQGINTIVLAHPGISEIDFYNFDRITLQAEANLENWSCYHYEGEKATITGTAKTQDDVTATGLLRALDPGANGKFGYTVNVESATYADVYLRMGSFGAASGSRPLSQPFASVSVGETVYTIGKELADHVFYGVGVYNQYKIVYLGKIALAAGDNEVSINRPASGGWLNLDCAYIVPLGETPVYTGDELVVENVNGVYNNTEYKVSATAPNGWSIAYENNSLVQPGTQEVKVTFSHDAYQDVVKTATINVYYASEAKGISVSLKGKIALNFYLDVAEETLADESAKVVFSIAEEQVKEVPVSTLEKDENGLYVASYELNAKDYQTDVVCDVTTTAGIAKSATSSIEDYADMIDASQDAKYDDVRELVKAMDEYCEIARAYFASEEATEDLYSEVTAEVLEQYKGSVSGSQDGVSIKASTLTLETEIVIRIYFKAENGVEGLVCTVDGQNAEIKQNGNYYYVEKKVVASQLSTEYTFAIGEITVEYSAMSYAYTVLATSDSVALKNVVRALYNYGVATTEYVEQGV